MSTETATEGRDLIAALEAREIRPEEIAALRRNTACSEAEWIRLEGLAGPPVPVPEDADRSVCLVRGIGHWALGRATLALDYLKKAGSSEVALYAYALAALEAHRPAQALEAAEKLVAKDEKQRAFREVQAEASARSGDVAAAQAALKPLEKGHADDPTVRYLRGLLREADGDWAGALEQYEGALEQDPQHARALFRLAYLMDLRGEDQEAMRLYEKLRSLQPTYIHALVNLGLLYEDAEDYPSARSCYEAILRADPNHQRARLFLKDASSAMNMYYDEEQERRDDKLNAVLRTPITDFELSVRSRNCLAKMNIQTLGDLVEKSEQELLSYKNFGETSLLEIKEILASKGLRLGMRRREGYSAPSPADVIRNVFVTPPPPAPSAVDPALATSITELGLSMRSRKCMASLNIQTVGDLAAKSEQELLTVKNFGQTSLDEVKAKLAERGLSLKPDEKSP